LQIGFRQRDRRLQVQRAANGGCMGEGDIHMALEARHETCIEGASRSGW
jgi:hypothetical protein